MIARDLSTSLPSEMTPFRVGTDIVTRGRLRSARAAESKMEKQRVNDITRQ
jgi:hypothetical protein